MNYHLPVLLNESIEGLGIHPGGVYVDATYGGGGHTRAILEKVGDTGMVYAFDRDADAVANADEEPRLKILHEDFRFMKKFLRLYGVRIVDGIIADLGVSSHQIDEAGRGFSTRQEGELDMRMDRRQEVTAQELVNDLSEEELTVLLRNYGELPNAKQMARAICRYRAEKHIATTFDLREAVERHLPRGMENKYLAMLFQALRIEVNGELEALRELLCQSVDLLKEGGRIAVISYHSLEDRLVKNFFKTGNFEGKLEKDFYGNPIVPLRVVTRHAVTASEEELQRNNRSRSAKLRVAEKLESKN